MLVMDTRDIRPDPCDARLINFSNCLQMLSCICYILSIVMEELEELALLIDFAADIFFALISSCMLAQVNLELKSQPRPANWGKQNAFPRSGSKAMAQRVSECLCVLQRVQHVLCLCMYACMDDWMYMYVCTYVCMYVYTHK